MDLDDDHDLLTFAESGTRLQAEIDAVAAALTSCAAGARAGLQARLAALREAATRNGRDAAAKPGETGFLTYVPPPR